MDRLVRRLVLASGIVAVGIALGHLALIDGCLSARVGLLAGLLLVAVAAEDPP